LIDYIITTIRHLINTIFHHRSRSPPSIDIIITSNITYITYVIAYCHYDTSHTPPYFSFSAARLATPLRLMRHAAHFAASAPLAAFFDA